MESVDAECHVAALCSQTLEKSIKGYFGAQRRDAEARPLA